MFHVPDGMVSTESIDQCLLVQQRAGVSDHMIQYQSVVFFYYFLLVLDCTTSISCSTLVPYHSSGLSKMIHDQNRNVKVFVNTDQKSIR